MDALFIIKKLVVALVSPLTIALLLGLFAWVCIAINRKRLGLFSLLLSLLITWGASFAPIGDALMWQHESKYPAFQYQPDLEVDAIHVLGGGHSESRRFANGAQLSASSLSRVTEGIRLARMYPDALLVFSGYEGFSGTNKQANAEVARQFALSIGIDAARIRVLTESKDTREEAIDVSDFIQQGSLLLVTSASHMPRAVAIFKQEKLRPIPAPTYFLGAEHSAVSHPSYSALQKTERYAYEQVGLLWIRVKAWLDS